jgi:hypothetical protein
MVQMQLRQQLINQQQQQQHQQQMQQQQVAISSVTCDCAHTLSLGTRRASATVARHDTTHTRGIGTRAYALWMCMCNARIA